VAKFTLKIQPTTNKNKIINKLTPANIERISPPIPAKSQKDVNQISKYFKNIKLANCYDLKLELRLHLGKDLRKCKGWIEVVKHKDTEEYLCYIY